jgi:hypothetical protein
MSEHPMSLDWKRREFASQVQYNIEAVVQFLNEFDHLTRLKLATMNEKLMKLERALDYIEASVSHANQQQSNDDDEEPGAENN